MILGFICFIGLGYLLNKIFGGDNVADKIQYHVFFLDVGQGEATLIVKRVIPDKGETKCYTMLVDTDSGETINPATLIKDCVPKIKRNGTEVYFIDSMLITHPHDDHIGGLNFFINDADICVGKIFHPDYDFPRSKETADYKAYKKLKKDSCNQTETRIIAGQDYGSDTGISFTTFSPPKTIENAEKFKNQSEKIQVHNQCSVIKVDLNGTKLLFLGDANQECAKRILKYYKEKIPSTILSASHHGSNSIFVPEIDIEENLSSIKRGDKDNSWDEEILDIIDPEYVIISCGKDNKYKHPHSAALEAYKEKKRNVKRTDIEGTIYFVVDDNGKYVVSYLKSYDSVKKTIKGLFPSTASTNESVKSFFVGGSSLPIPPRNA